MPSIFYSKPIEQKDIKTQEIPNNKTYDSTATKSLCNIEEKGNKQTETKTKVENQTNKETNQVKTEIIVADSIQNKELSNKVTVIGIHPPGFPIKKIQKFVRRYKPAIPYMLAIDLDKNLIKTHSITVLPRIVLVNRYGKVLYDHLGYAQEKEGEVKNAISALL